MAQDRVLVEKVKQNVTKNAANRTAATREMTDCWFLGDRPNERVHARPKTKTTAVQLNGVNARKVHKDAFWLGDGDVHQ